eukprot:2015180-Lingulodinium_polyedra.AAC.1
MRPLRRFGRVASSRIRASPTPWLARRGPNAGPQGGVAVFVPAPWRITRQLELVAGCALAVRAARP